MCMSLFPIFSYVQTSIKNTCTTVSDFYKSSKYYIGNKLSVLQSFLSIGPSFHLNTHTHTTITNVYKYMYVYICNSMQMWIWLYTNIDN